MKSAYVALLLILTISGCSSADDSNWQWLFGSLDSGGSYFGVSMAALDDFDSLDQLAQPIHYSYIATYHEKNIDGWTGDTGFYSSDFRSPMNLVPGQSKTWTFYLWARFLYPYSQLRMTWGFDEPPWPAFDTTEYTLTYVKAADGITGGESIPIGTSRLLNVWTQWAWSFPVYKTNNGLTGYKFELTATIIPEPSSLLALAGGLMGLAGLLRKKVNSKR